ncbi:hypothetical protein [Bacillus sp. P14.5]|uniref:hypothetical protein n=1 Tax=Bacillus sp. P14.5 TaxID=1983400 RepID=UPI000DE9DBE1|nr:hypothetical protein [Bacillus sp. P14.5]
MENGRDLDKFLFQIYFEGDSNSKVLSELKDYQGSDGGFRNLGEGDSATSNVMDTNMAFQCLSEVGAKHTDEIVQKGISFIISSFDEKNTCWHPNPMQKENVWADNPCAELLGYLYEFSDLVPVNFLERLTEKALSSMTTYKTTTEKPEFYFLSALCLYRLSERIKQPYKQYIEEQLKNDILDIIETNPDKWSTSYCAKPYYFAESLINPLLPTIKTYVIQSLENEISTQAEDGHFILNWSADEESTRAWKSINTLSVLKFLRNNQMIDFN